MKKPKQKLSCVPVTLVALLAVVVAASKRKHFPPNLHGTCSLSPDVVQGQRNP